MIRIIAQLFTTIVLLFLDSIVTSVAQSIEPPEGGCYGNLDDVYIVIANDANLFTMKTFTLCPNTVFTPGVIKPGIGIVEGQVPIVPRSNMEIKCGEDGSSTNNCIIRGGDYGLLSSLMFFPDADVTNVLIQGITFEMNLESTMYFELPGDFTFEDCIIRNQRNSGPIVMNNIGQVYYRRQRKLIKSSKQDENIRQLQRNTKDLEITFFNCSFSDNTQISSGANLEYGLITVLNEMHHVTLDQCEFMRNNFGNESIAPYGYALSADSGTITLNSNCFVNNDFFGPGIAIMGPGTIITSNNNYGTVDDDLDCSFIASYETESDLENTAATCIAYESTTCSRTGITSSSSSSSSSSTSTNGAGSGEDEETRTSDGNSSTNGSDEVKSQNGSGDGDGDSSGGNSSSSNGSADTPDSEKDDSSDAAPTACFVGPWSTMLLAIISFSFVFS